MNAMQVGNAERRRRRFFDERPNQVIDRVE
jgi:hypothetical protein